MSESTQDPFRADAGVVWRLMGREPGLSVAEMADRLFPVPSEGPESSLVALRRLSVRRVLDSIVWMRHQKVVITAVPGNPSRFWLGEREIDPLKVPRALSRMEVVTAEVAQPVSEAIETRDGGAIMDIYHPK